MLLQGNSIELKLKYQNGTPFSFFSYGGVISRLFLFTAQFCKHGFLLSLQGDLIYLNTIILIFAEWDRK